MQRQTLTFPINELLIVSKLLDMNKVEIAKQDQETEEEWSARMAENLRKLREEECQS